MKRINVNYFTGSLNLGGTERNILHLATRLDPDRFAVRVWSDYEGEPIQRELRARGIECASLKPGHSLGKPLLQRVFQHNLPYQKRLYRALRSCRGGIVHAFGFPAAYYVTIIGRMAGCKNIIFSVQDWDVWKKAKIYRFLDRTSSRLAAKIIADGAGARSQAITRQGMSAGKLITIYDGVNTQEIVPSRSAAEVRREIGMQENRITVGVIARLDIAKKAQDVFISALGRLANQTSDAQFVIVGDGPDRAEIERLVASLPANFRPAMPGFRTDLADILNALDILVISSRWESVPKILLEAMWLSKPVLATRVGDIPEILDADCGVLVPPDDPAAMAAALEGLCADGALRAKLGAAARQRIIDRRLTLDDSIRQYEELYERLAYAAG